MARGAMKPRRPLHPYLMLAPTALVFGLFFLYPLALAPADELLRVGFAHAARLRRPAQLRRPRRERRARRHRGPHARLQRRRGLALGHARPRARRRARPARAASTPSSAAPSSAPTSSRGWRSRCSGCGSSTPTRGLLTVVLRRLHLPTRNWLGDPHVALLTLALVSVWKITGYSMVIFLAGLQDIPRVAPRGRRARRRRPVAALLPRHLAAAPPQRRVRRHHQPHPLVPGLRRGAGDDAGRAR